MQWQATKIRRLGHVGLCFTAVPAEEKVDGSMLGLGKLLRWTTRTFYRLEGPSTLSTMLDLALVDYNLHSYCSLIHLEPTDSVFVALFYVTFTDWMYLCAMIRARESIFLKSVSDGNVFSTPRLHLAIVCTLVPTLGYPTKFLLEVFC